MVDQLANFLERVASEPRVNLHIHIGSEIAQRMAREQLPKIHRHRHLDGLSVLPQRNLFRLQIVQRLHHCRAQKLRHRNAVLFCARLHLRHAQHHRHQIHIAVRLRRTAQVPGGRLPAACLDISGIAQEAVFQFLLVRLFESSEHALFRRNVDAVFFAQIFRQQRLEENESARAVGDGVEKLDRNPVFVYQHPERTFSDAVERHVLQRAAFLRLNLRRFGNLL